MANNFLKPGMQLTPCTFERLCNDPESKPDGIMVGRFNYSLRYSKDMEMIPKITVPEDIDIFSDDGKQIFHCGHWWWQEWMFKEAYIIIKDLNLW